MKRILAVLIAVMLLVAVMPATSLAAGIVSNGDSKVFHAATNGGTLHLRAEASTKAGIVSSLPNGTALVRVSSKTVRKDGYVWMQVRTTNGMKGWVAKKWIKDYAHADVNTQKDGLNVRPKPNTKKKAMYSIPHGTKDVVIQAVNGNWAKVNWNKKGTGYASLSYLRWVLW